MKPVAKMTDAELLSCGTHELPVSSVVQDVLREFFIRLQGAQKREEKERMRLAACGAAALGYDKRSVLEEYRSASFDDVVSLRDKYEKLLCRTTPTVQGPTTGTTHHDISSELWREYDFGGRVYRIDNPVELVLHRGGTTHRVVDAKGTAHCVPSPGQFGCILRWKSREGLPPVKF